MNSNFRRFEILLPLQFNDGQTIPNTLLGQTVTQLRDQFGSVSTETQIIRGLWQHAGTSYRDELTRIFVDVPDTPENREFFRSFKEQLKVRFQQLDIWMVAYPVEVI